MLKLGTLTSIEVEAVSINRVDEEAAAITAKFARPLPGLQAQSANAKMPPHHQIEIHNRAIGEARRDIRVA